MAIFDFITGFDRDNYEAGQRADAQRKQLLEERAQRLAREAGEATAAEFRRQLEENNRRSDGIGDGTGRTPDQAISDGFFEGLDDGRQNVRNTIGGTLNGIFKNVFGIVPWQVWILAIAFGLWKSGLWKKLLPKSA